MRGEQEGEGTGQASAADPGGGGASRKPTWGRVLPCPGRRCTARDSLLPLTLQPLCPRRGGDIRWGLVLSLLLALLQFLFLPPTRRPGGVGNRRQSSTRDTFPPLPGVPAWPRPQPHQRPNPRGAPEPRPHPTHLCLISTLPLPGPPGAWGLPGAKVWGWRGVKGTRCDISASVCSLHTQRPHTERC